MRRREFIKVLAPSPLVVAQPNKFLRMIPIPFRNESGVKRIDKDVGRMQVGKLYIVQRHHIQRVSRDHNV